MAKKALTNADYFKVYHAENPQIYETFKAFAFQLIAAGVSKLSSYLIFERMRWETLVTGNDGYKLNNNYRPYYSRLFMQDYPQYEGFFSIRSVEAERA